MNKIAILTLLLCLSLCPGTQASALNADSLKVAADSSYVRGDFRTAAKQYKALERTPLTCYNLGNCYYRLDDLARAILWWERSARLDPSSADTRENLALARSKIVDKVVPRHEFFLVEWWANLTNIMSQDAWGWLALALFAVALACLLVAFFGGVRLCQLVSAPLFLLWLLTTLCAWSQGYRLRHHSAAIVMSPSAVVRSTPSEAGSDLFVLHEGTRVEIRDATLSQWTEVELADGKVGWIEAKAIETI